MKKVMINYIISSDLYRFSPKKSILSIISTCKYPGFRYMLIIRLLAQMSRYNPIKLVLRFLKRRYMFKYGFQISEKTKIGPGFYIGHFGTIVINQNSETGKNCNITHNVTIGRTNRGKLKGSPVIGDEVWIGTGSVIVGKIIIGNNVLIAPNSFVNFDVPNNSIVIGNPGKIIRKNNPTKNYINNKL